jgi:hypothetical protein
MQRVSRTGLSASGVGARVQPALGSMCRLPNRSTRSARPTPHILISPRRLSRRRLRRETTPRPHVAHRDARRSVPEIIREVETAIRLADWQREITGAHPEELIRGLIHSDGSRCNNRFKVKLPSGRVGSYAYVRYFFTNYSADIRGIFCEHCDLLGIRWTQSSFKNISIAHRDSVALLDSFVGPKR